jgi:hypothetical protein
MKEQRLEILRKVAKGELTPEQADEQLLGLSIVSKRSWHIGEKVVVTHCIYGHEFDNGTTVEIVDHEPSQTTSWLCSDGNYSWWLSEEEGYVC